MRIILIALQNKNTIFDINVYNFIFVLIKYFPASHSDIVEGERKTKSYKLYIIMIK